MESYKTISKIRNITFIFQNFKKKFLKSKRKMQKIPMDSEQLINSIRRFFSLILIFALFPWTNVMQLSKQSLVRWTRFHSYHCPYGNTHIKNGRSFNKYSKFTPTIHIISNSYSFRIIFIMIIVRFFIICFING